MIRERLQAEKQLHVGTQSSAVPSGVPEWHDEIVQAAQTIRPSHFDEESILLRSRLIRSVKTAPHDLNSWRALLKLLDDERKKAIEGGGCNATASLEMHNAILRLYETATRVIPRSAVNRYSLVYLSIWLDLAAVQAELPEDAYLARDLFKQLKTNRIGVTLPQFWNAYADFELSQGDQDKAAKLRAEISRRCPTNGSMPGGTTGSAQSAGSIPRRPQQTTAVVPTQRQRVTRPPSVEKENSPGTTPLPLQPSPAVQASTRAPPTRREMLCTPPSAVPPQPKRINFGTSPEAMRREARPAVFEEPDLISDINVEQRASVDRPSRSSAALTRTTSASRSGANELSESSSWKMRALQSRHTEVQVQVEAHAQIQLPTTAQASVPQRRVGNGTPHAVYGARRIEPNRSDSSLRRNGALAVRPTVVEKSVSSRHESSAITPVSAISPPPPAPIIPGSPVATSGPPPKLHPMQPHSRDQPAIPVGGLSSNGPRRTESSDTSSSKELRRRERVQYSRSRSNAEENSGAASALPTFLRDISREEIVVVNDRQYLILGSVGKGGSSRVYKVLNSSRTIMALKRVHVRKCANFKSTFDSYANEIDLLRRLRGKPNIVYCYDAEVREESGIIHLVMEYGDIDLAKRLNETTNKTKILDENFRRLYWQQMLEAVRTIHEAKIVHGDLKPANFLIVAGTLKLIDFGIAKAIPTEDTTKIFRDVQVGTPNYMSPEALISYDGDEDTSEMRDVQSNGFHSSKPKYRVGRASDIWSLGCILYQMVYGKTPFAHLTNIMQKLTCIQDDSYAIHYGPIDDTTILSALEGCLQRNPSNRMSIPELLEHPYLRRGARDDYTNGSMNTVSIETIADDAAAVTRWIIQRLQENGCEIRSAAGLRAPPTEGIDPDWDTIVENVTKDFPREWCTSYRGRGDLSGNHSLNGRKGMLTPTTSGITNQATRTHGHSFHSYNATRSTDRA